MSSLGAVFASLNQMRDEGIVTQYAIGGATAVLFYAEPTRTYDVDVFALIPETEDGALASLATVYAWARAHGCTVDAEHLMMYGVPVQVLPAWSPLVVEAIATARIHDYDGIPVRVVDPDCLVALALQSGGARRRERAWQLFESGAVSPSRVRDLCARHGIDARIPDDV